MRILVLYYSFSGNTRRVAEKLAMAMGADLEPITCNAYSYGLIGNLRQAWDIATRGTPPIELPDRIRAGYDLVVAGGPVWAGHPAGPIRTYVRRRARLSQKLALFLTCNGTSARFPGERALDELVKMAPTPPVATHLFKEADILGDHIDSVAAVFGENIREVMAPVALSAPASGPARPRRT